MKMACFIEAPKSQNANKIILSTLEMGNGGGLDNRDIKWTEIIDW